MPIMTELGSYRVAGESLKELTERGSNESRMESSLGDDIIGQDGAKLGSNPSLNTKKQVIYCL